MNASVTHFSTDFEGLVQKQPNAVALILKDDLNPVEITYRELNNLINRAVHYYLHEKGLKKGDTVVALLPNSAEMMVAYLATVKAGLRFAPLSCTATPNEIKSWIGLVNPKCTIATDLLTGKSLKAASSAGPEPSFLVPDGLYSWLRDQECTDEDFGGGAELLISTSGSTGEPKAMVIDSDRLWSSGIAFSDFHGLRDRRLRFWNFLPMSYLGGLYNLAMIPLSTGGAILVDSPFSGSTFLSFWQTVNRYEINTLWLVPTIVNGLLKMSRRLPKDFLEMIRSRVNMAFLGTAPISLETKERFESTFGFPLLENYALSETTFITSEHLRRSDVREEGSTGRVLPYVVVDLKPLDSVAPTDHTEGFGEIRVQTPYLFTGYLGSDGSIDDAMDSDGYFRTGDVGILTEDGQLKITGRIRDILKKGGYMISLTEVEHLAQKFNGVSEAAAVKITHDFYGESYNLYIVPEQPDEQDQQQLLNQFEPNLHNHLVKYKWPEKVLVISSLPKTTSGKIQKHLITVDSVS